MVDLIIIACSAAVSLGVCLLFLGVYRAPGWEHYRYASLIAFASALYALCGTQTDSEMFSVSLPLLLGRLNFILALLTPIAWFYFDRGQAKREFQYLEKVAIAVLFYGAIITCIPGATIDSLQTLELHWAGIYYTFAGTTWLGDLFILIVLACFASVASRIARRAAASAQESWLQFWACVIFILGAGEEGLVVVGVLQWPFLGSVGFTLSVFFMALDLAFRITRNARKLERGNEVLKERIAASTHDLMIAKQVLMSTERHSAMGSLVASVSHEINNPLAYVSGNVHFVKDSIEEDGGLSEEFLAAEDALQSVEEIQDVIANQQLYVRAPQDHGIANVKQAVDVAIRVVRPKTKFTIDLQVVCDSDADVEIGESRLVQVLVNLLLGAVVESKGVSLTTLSVHEEKGMVCIGLRAQGWAKLPLRKGNTNGSETMKRHELAFFVCCGVVEANGGLVLMKSVPVGEGSWVEIQLPMVPKNTQSVGGG